MELEELQQELPDRYRVIREIGRGGMAIVYLVEDVLLERSVAMKVLSPELGSSIDGERFKREIRIAAQLSHPNILPAYDSGVAGKLLYYVMPFVEGESLRARMERVGQLTIEDAIGITCEVADALEYAHSQGVVHRDIKPENILLQSGHAVVADFGIARLVQDAGNEKLTQTGMSIGTASYMSPEQFSGLKVDGKSDQYALACVLYEMLVGEVPFTGPNAIAIMARATMQEVPSVRMVRQAVPPDIELAIFQALEKTSADRFASVGAFKDALLGAQGASTYVRQTRAYTAAYRVTHVEERRRLTPRRIGMFAAAALMITIAMSGAKHYWPVKSALAGDVDARRVAVLYFTDESKDKDLGPLADGLTEDLINSLRNASAITLISRSGVERFRGGDVASDSIARALRAGYLIRGSLDREAGKIIVYVKLLDRSGAPIQQQKVSIDEKNQLAMRDSLQSVVSDLIKGTLHEEIQLRTQQSATSNQQAWLELQRAEQSRKAIAGLLTKGDTAAVERAVASTDSILSRAEQLDPKWAEPITRRAILAYQRSRTVGRDPALIRKWVDLGLGHAARALATSDGESPDALEVRGTLKYWSWISNLETDAEKKKVLLDEARVDLEQATQKNPKQASAYAILASLYYQVENATPNDVYIAATKAYDADEFLSNANVVLHRLFIAAYDLNQYDKAVQHCKTFSGRFPNDYRSKRCQLFLLTMPKAPMFDVAQAQRLADSVVAMRPPKDSLFERLNTNMVLAAAMARASKEKPALADSARALAKRSIGDATVDPNRDQAFYAAFVYEQLHDDDLAFRMLTEYIAANPQRAISLRDDPGWWFNRLAPDRRYKQLVGAQ
ncbi:MAG: protein kinase [Gemmatimonadaceae bacterium]